MLSNFNSGKERYFYDGWNQNSRNCQCGNEGGCQSNQNALCNCDLRPRDGTKDPGIIRTEWLLPITEFGYKFHGHSLNTFAGKNGSATMQIGDIICRGNYFKPFVYLI